MYTYHPRRAYFQRFMRRVMYAGIIEDWWSPDFDEVPPFTTAQYRALMDNIELGKPPPRPDDEENIPEAIARNCQELQENIKFFTQIKLEKGMSPIEEQIKSYEGKCALCKFFRGAYQRERDDGSGLWLDDPGWCVRYPPVYVGRDFRDAKDSPQYDTECYSSQFAQPGVQGSDECGEYVCAVEFKNT